MVTLGIIVKPWLLTALLMALIWMVSAGGALLYALLAQRRNLNPMAGAFYVFFLWMIAGIMISGGVDPLMIVRQLWDGEFYLAIVPPGANLQSLLEGCALSALFGLGIATARHFADSFAAENASEENPPSAAG